MIESSITNLSFDKKSGMMLLKTYGNLELEQQRFKQIVYSRHGFIPKGQGYDVEESKQLFFFTKKKADRIVVYNDNSWKKIMEYPLEGLYLFDLSTEQQYMIHNDLDFSTKYKIGYLDIETDDDINADAALSPILLISMMIDGKVKVFDAADYAYEADMLEAFFNWVLNETFPDVVLGWNVINFDRKYIIKRSQKLHARYDSLKFSLIEFTNLADVLLKKFGYPILKDTGGLSLDNVSKYFLGLGKKKLPKTFGKVYQEDRELAFEYNLTDLILIEELNNKLQLLDFLLRIQRISGVRLSHTFYNSIVIDSMILRRYRQYVFPGVKPGKDDEVTNVEYEGGYVLSPPKGIFENVAIIDFAAMYPSIILTFNISPDSKTSTSPDYKIDDVGFKAQPYGIFKETIKYLFNERLALKTKLKELEKESLEYKNLDTLQSAYKTILNSFYGVCAFKRFRFYDVDLAKTITFMGRTLLHVVKDRIEENGLGKVLYGDTDSIFVQFTGDVKAAIDLINNKFIPEFVQTFGIDRSENFLAVELSDIYDKMIFFGKKKKYIARINGKFHIKGFETEKYDVPKKFRNLMKEIILSLIEGNGVDLAKYRTEIEKFDLIDYAILKRFNKSPNSYKVKPQHLRALEWSESYDLVDPTDKKKMVKMLFVEVDEKLGYKETDVMALDEEWIKELPEGVKLNFDRYFHFFLIQKMEDLYEIFGIDYEQWQ